MPRQPPSPAASSNRGGGPPSSTMSNSRVNLQLEAEELASFGTISYLSNVNVAELRKIFSNAAVLHLKRRFDLLDEVCSSFPFFPTSSTRDDLVSTEIFFCLVGWGVSKQCPERGWSFILSRVFRRLHLPVSGGHHAGR